MRLPFVASSPRHGGQYNLQPHALKRTSKGDATTVASPTAGMGLPIRQRERATPSLSSKQKHHDMTGRRLLGTTRLRVKEHQRLDCSAPRLARKLKTVRH